MTLDGIVISFIDDFENDFFPIFFNCECAAKLIVLRWMHSWKHDSSIWVTLDGIVIDEREELKNEYFPIKLNSELLSNDIDLIFELFLKEFSLIAMTLYLWFLRWFIILI